MHLSYHLHIHHFMWFLEADVCLHVDLCCPSERCCKLNVSVYTFLHLNTMIKAGCLSLSYSVVKVMKCSD